MLAEVFGLILLLSSDEVTADQPQQPPTKYVILRVKDPATFQTTSAQFKLRQSANMPEEAWNCMDGPNPISYTVNRTMRMRARSIDVKVGKSVECLGIRVSAVVGRLIPVWQGDAIHCPGLLTTSSDLEEKTYSTTIYFEFKPATQFQVYSSEPSAECASLEYQNVEHPRIKLRSVGRVLTSCSVVGEQLHLLSCNMTVTAGRDLIAVAEDRKDIQVPGFIWKTDLNLITCKCECRIKGMREAATRTASANFTRSDVGNQEYSINNGDNDEDGYPSFSASNTPKRPTDSTNDKLLAVILSLSIMVVMMIIVSIFLFVTTRDLRIRLKKVRQDTIAAAGGYSFRNVSKLPHYATAPPGGRMDTGRMESDIYSSLHCSHNDCRFYNHTNVKLPDFHLRPATYERPQIPLYHKISLSEEGP